MNRILIFARRAAAVLALAALGVAALSSCKPEEKVMTPLETPQPRLLSSTVSSLTFTWDKVAHTSQYTYELLSADGSSVDGGVTAGVKAEFTGLSDNTTYTFRLIAHPAVNSSDYESSMEGTVNATTVTITPLATPVLTVSTEGTATVSWEAIDNAAYYKYTCTSENGTDIFGSTTGTIVTLSGLKTGEYTVTVRAISEYEACSDSETASVTFTYEAVVEESWSVTGTVSDGGGNSWNATLVSWSDGSYTLRNWYNVEGYDLEFVINSDGSMSITNNYKDYEPNIWVASGDSVDDGWVQLYTKTYGSDYYSYFSGDQTSGDFYVYNYRTSGWYEFVWPASGGGEDEKTELWSTAGTVDDGAGKKWDATLVAWSDDSYTLKAWYGTEGYDLEFTVNENATITVSNVTESSGYNYVLANADKWICIDTKYYEGYGTYSEFSGNKDAGEVWFWSYETNGYYDFVWPASGGSQGGDEGGETGGAITVDDLVGTYAQSSVYVFWYNNAWGTYSSTNDVTIAKVDDKTVSIDGLIYEASSGGKIINATFDAENAKLTIEPQMLTEYYKFGGYDKESDPITVTYKDGVLTFDYWCLWYNGYYYAYSKEATTLTKK